MNTQEMTILENLVAVHLDVNIWSARKKLTPADFSGAELPPQGLASLGSKKICNPQELRIFGTLKARAVNLLDRTGVRFLGGWGIPEDTADEIANELSTIRDAFIQAKEQFLIRYDDAVRDWISQHPGWEQFISSSSVSAEYVRSRFGFRWQFFKLLPPTEHVIHSGLREEMNELGDTLFQEVAKAATDAWKRCYDGKDKVTHKALSPLRSIQQKLEGLSFVDPRAIPLSDLLQAAFAHLPKRGHIQGKNLLMLQGVVAQLRDPATLVKHGEKLQKGQDALGILTGLHTYEETRSVPIPAAALASPVPQQRIDSQGLW